MYHDYAVSLRVLVLVIVHRAVDGKIGTTSEVVRIRERE